MCNETSQKENTMKWIVIWSFVFVSFLLPLSDESVQAGQKQDKNLIRNANLEQGGVKNPPGWRRVQSGTNTSTFEVLNWKAYGYGRVLHVKVWEHTSGFAGWAFKHVPVKPRRTYVWKSTFMNEGASVIRAEFKTRSGKIVTKDLDVLPWHTMDYWITLTYEFVVPPDAISVSISHCVTRQGGILSRNTSLTEK